VFGLIGVIKYFARVGNGCYPTLGALCAVQVCIIEKEMKKKKCENSCGWGSFVKKLHEIYVTNMAAVPESLEFNIDSIGGIPRRPIEIMGSR
jgi:hypothetical protein